MRAFLPNWSPRAVLPAGPALCALLLVCGLHSAGCAKHHDEQPSPGAEAVQKKTSFTGRIEGTVRLAQGAQLPRLADIKNGSKFAVVPPPAPCSPLSDADLEPVTMGAKRGLSNIHIALTDMASAPANEPTTHDVYLTDCRLKPSMIGVIRGDSVRITNRSGAALLPTITGESFMQAILPDASRTVQISKSGAFSISCGFGAFCGRTEVLATTHPLYAVSDEVGAFTVEGVPLDDEVVVHAWHPLFQGATETVRLSSKQPSRTVSFVLKPAVAPAPVTPATQPAKGQRPAKAKSEGALLDPI